MGEPHAEISRVFAKGQTVIPKPLRNRLDLKEGDFISWEPVENGLLVRRAIVQPTSSSEWLSGSDWNALDGLVADQRAKNQKTSYADLEAAKKHSRKLARSRRPK
jgi:AbrB family looped-hinge helix DNA binding protein